jgi:hypothetical protein
MAICCIKRLKGAAEEATADRAYNEKRRPIAREI